jgi:hypothetical protein
MESLGQTKLVGKDLEEGIVGHNWYNETLLDQYLQFF